MAICICGDSSSHIFDRLTTEERDKAYYVDADDILFEVPDRITARGLSQDIWGDEDTGVDILVRRKRDRQRVPGLGQSVVGSKLPSRSLIKLRSGVVITSPWYELVRHATSMSMVEISIQIMTLTSIFKLNPLSPDGFDESTPIISWFDLEQYVSDAKGMPGIKRVREAMGWSRPNARSPREIDLTLMLCMPYRHGGCGLPVPELNHEVQPGGIAATMLEKQTCFIDLFWRSLVNNEYACGVEYLGKDRHKDIGEDLTRVYAMRLLKIDLLLVADEQFSDALQMLMIAQDIAKSIGFRPRGDRWPTAKRLQELIDEIDAG